MKKSLGELTAAEFVDLLCGDTSVVTGYRALKYDVWTASVVRKILFEFKSICDIPGMRADMRRAENIARYGSEIAFYAMCKDMLQPESQGLVRTLLDEYGIRTAGMTFDRLAAEIESRMERALHEKKKIEDSMSDTEAGKTKNEETRESFAELTAALIAHFKVQIDPHTIKADVFAHLAARREREIKTLASSLKKQHT